MQATWQALINFSQDLPEVRRGRNEHLIKLEHGERHAGRWTTISFAVILTTVLAFTNGRPREGDVTMEFAVREPVYEWKTIIGARALILKPNVWCEMVSQLLRSVGY